MVTERLLPIQAIYMGQLLQGNTSAIIDYMSGVQEIIGDTNSAIVRLKSGTNTFRLVAPKNLTDLVDKLESKLVLTFEQTSTVMTKMCKPEIMNNPTAIEELQAPLSRYAEQIMELKQQLMDAMRKSLEEI